METTKIRTLSDGELKQEQVKAGEQIFRLRFQMKLGQNEGVKKMRELKKDVARIQTIAQERALGVRGAAAQAEGSTTPAPKGRKAKKGTR